MTKGIRIQTVHQDGLLICPLSWRSTEVKKRVSISPSLYQEADTNGCVWLSSYLQDRGLLKLEFLSYSHFKGPLI